MDGIEPENREGSKAKSLPEAKGWVKRVVAAAGVIEGAGEKWEKKVGWWGVEMERFLAFARGFARGEWSRDWSDWNGANLSNRAALNLNLNLTPSCPDDFDYEHD